MSSVVGEANVIVRPIVADFRAQVATAVNRQLVGAKAVPLPVQPTITPQAKAKFAAETTNFTRGIRGGLLGIGEGIGARALGISALAGGVFLFGKASLGAIKGAANLEQSLNVFQVTAGATAEQMARVREEARRLGADILLPAVSAGDAATTMTELAKAGLSVDQVLKGTRGTLQLAAAAQLDFATASELSANALNSFQLSGNDAVRVADLLAGAANAAQGNMGDFGQGLSQVATVAHQAGLTLDETVTFLTEFAKAGISGSDAGTSLRVALLRLIAPTQEAKDIFNALGVDLAGFQSGRIRAPEFFEDLKNKMAPLDKATRNAALATIFGTDAIRVAAIAVQESGRHFDALAGQVTRAGEAQKITDARSKGLSGQFEGLKSNIDTLGTSIGSFATGPLTELIAGLSLAVTGATNLIGKLEDLGKVKLPKQVPGSDSNTIGDLARQVQNFTSFLGPLRAGLKLLRDDAEKPITPIVNLGDRSSPQFDKAALEADARDARNIVVKALHIPGTEVDKAERALINAAKRGVREAQLSMRQIVAEGQQAVADTIKQGADAIEASAVSAKQNLATIGQTLSQQVTDILDSGPLAQRIKALQESLSKSQDALQRQTLGRSLRDANEELKRAQAQVAAPQSATERAGARQFLRPFEERVKDAQSALEEFNTQGNIDKLTARLTAQKDRIQRVLNDVIAKFNAGLLSAPQVNARVAALLERNVGPMGKAGKAQGFAFREAFRNEVLGLQAQLAAIIGGPRTTKSGAEPTVVRPADVAAQAAKDTASAIATAAQGTQAAQRNVKEAIANLHKTEKDAVAAVTEPGGTNDLLKQILSQLKGTPAKPSADVKTPAKPRAKTGSR